uniref:Uncharacterized protein n=1 Tax=Amorphochlora amoebiformis TaxID=1561963 RepID=A0A7S0GNU7_9EUKA
MDNDHDRIAGDSTSVSRATSCLSTIFHHPCQTGAQTPSGKTHFNDSKTGSQVQSPTYGGMDFTERDKENLVKSFFVTEKPKTFLSHKLGSKQSTDHSPLAISSSHPNLTHTSSQPLPAAEHSLQESFNSTRASHATTPTHKPVRWTSGSKIEAPHAYPPDTRPVQKIRVQHSRAHSHKTHYPPTPRCLRHNRQIHNHPAAQYYHCSQPQILSLQPWNHHAKHYHGQASSGNVLNQTEKIQSQARFSLRINIKHKLGKKRLNNKKNKARYRFDTTLITRAILEALGTTAFHQAYTVIKECHQGRNLCHTSALNLVHEIAKLYSRDINDEYFAFCQCFRAVLNEYFKLTRNVRKQREFPEIESYQVVADLESTNITIHVSGLASLAIRQYFASSSNALGQDFPPVQKSPSFHSDQASRSDRKQSDPYTLHTPTGVQPPVVPIDVEDETETFVTSAPTGGGPEPRINMSSRMMPNPISQGVKVAMGIQLTPLPGHIDQQSFMKWVTEKTERITYDLSRILHLEDMSGTTIRFPEALAEALAHWKRFSSEGKQESYDWTLTFKFAQENYFRNDGKRQDSARCDMLIDNCISILKRRNISFNYARANEGCIMCRFTTFASEILKVLEVRVAILNDFKRLVLDGKIKCLPTVSIIRNYNPRPTVNIKRISEPCSVKVVITATYLSAVFIINKLRELDDWRNEIFRILRIQAFPMHSNPLHAHELERLGDCMPTLKDLIAISQKSLLNGVPLPLVASVLALILEYWAFDAMPRGHLDLPPCPDQPPCPDLPRHPLEEVSPDIYVKPAEKCISEAVREGSIAVVKALMTTPEHEPANINNFIDTRGRTLLHTACRYNRAGVARLLIDAKATIDARDQDDRTPLHTACSNGNDEITRLLVYSKAKLEATERFRGMTPLLLACWKGRLAVVEYLMEAKANVRAVNGLGYGSLHCAVLRNEFPMVWHLLVNGGKVIDVDAVNNKGRTPLHIACSKGNLEIAKLLVSSKAKVEAYENKHGMTPLLLACGKGKLAMVQYLMDLKANAKAVDCHGNGPLNYAIFGKDSSTLKYLVDHSGHVAYAANKQGNGPLHFAVMREEVSMVKYLVLNGKVVIDAINDKGRTSLHIASSKGNVQIAQFLVESTAKLEASGNKYRMTPLLLACYEGKLAMVEYLVEVKANVKAVDRDGDSCLHYAVQGGNIATVKYLVRKRGILLDAVNRIGRTPLYYACRKGNVEITRLLVNSKAKLEASEKMFGMTPLLLACWKGQLHVVKYLVDIKANVRAADRDGYRVFHVAVKNEDVSMVRYLVNNVKTGIRAVNKQGQAPLHIACFKGNVQITRLLIESKAKLEASEKKSGFTPLLIACYRGKLEVVQYLVKAKANVKATNRDGYGPLYLAAMAGKISVVKYLMENVKAKDKNVIQKKGLPLVDSLRRLFRKRQAEEDVYYEILNYLEELELDIPQIDSLEKTAEQPEAKFSKALKCTIS